MANSQTNVAPQGWRVASQVPRKMTQPDGVTILDGYTIHFVTANGVSGSIWISEADYSVDNVRNAIAAKVRLLDGVSGLEG